MHSFLNFSRPKDVLVICNNTKENFLWEPKKMNVKFHKITCTSFTWDFQNFTSVSTILVKFDIHFLWLPWWLITSLGLEKWKKECNNYSLNNYSGTLYKVFVRWELKLLNFLVDSVLKTPTVKLINHYLTGTNCPSRSLFFIHLSCPAFFSRVDCS